MSRQFKWTPEAKAKLLACNTEKEMVRAFPKQTLANLVRRKSEFRKSGSTLDKAVKVKAPVSPVESPLPTSNLKVLMIDIETSPNLADVWGLFNVNVGLSQLRDSSFMMCFAAKWLGNDKVEFRSYFHDGKETMIKRAYELMSEADAIIHYNGIAFDIKTLNKELLLHGYPPPAPAKQIDLYRVVKSKFKFPSNKLAYVSEVLGLGGKVSHYGHEMWVKCLAGDKAAWKLMKEYNIQDTVLLESLYSRLLPWITNHPNQNIYSEVDEMNCTNCNSSDLRREGYAYTLGGKYQRYQCRNCNAWIRSTKREVGSALQSEKY